MCDAANSSVSIDPLMCSLSRDMRNCLGYCLLLAALYGGSPARGSDASPTLIRNSFLAENCFDCHTGESPEAGLNLEELSTDLADRSHLATWIDVHDRVSAGEMPPKEHQPLSAADVAPFLEATGHWLRAAQLRERSQQGRVPPRRLTNLQLERTLQSLLGIDIPLAERMPAEPRTGEYSTLAEKQSLSHYQMAEHLNIVDVALDEAFRRALTPDDQWSKALTAQQISRTRTRTREPEFIDGESVVWSGRLSFYGRMPAITAKEDGWYRVTFPARTLKTTDQDGVWCTVRSGKCVSSAAQLNWVGAFAALVEPREFSFEAWLPAGHMLEIRPGDPRLKQARFAGGQAADGEGGGQDVPGLAIAAMKVERFHRNADDAQIRHLLFGDLPVLLQQRADQAQVEVRDPQLDGEYLLQRFATRAFRRPVEAAQLHRFVEIYTETLNSQHSFVAALRAGYRAILCSARFMYFYEPPGELDDYSIAARLSYLLWNSLPDEQLLQLAAEGKLREPHVIEAQVDRMLASSQGQNFVRDFAAEWLELRDIGFTEPDPKLYPQFDMIVQASMLAETHTFLQHMLENDRPVHELIDSQTTFLNNRLADYYGIEGVHGDGLQRVELPRDSVRGGLLSQGAILKVTANGTHTSPVLRGVWISERLLGCPIPPPPEGVPAIEPDIRGATTIREQLEKHRQDSACAACHTKIDPPGFALENFDAAGGWRDVYPRVQKGPVKQSPPVDASFVLADGRPFANFQEFRNLSALDPVPLARNVATHVLTYGTGGKPEFADRPALEQIVEKAAEQAYGLRSIVKAVTTSRLFLDN
jgi:hypothetical protein